MRDALQRHMPPGCRWAVPEGGMFFWVELPESLDAAALLPRAVDAGVAYVPGAPFYCSAPRANTLRLSFVTVAPVSIDSGVRALAGVLGQALAEAGPAMAAAS
jgi:2-aminoadipate transaminase